MSQSNTATTTATVLDQRAMSVLSAFGVPRREKMAIARRLGPGGVTWVEQQDKSAPKLATVTPDASDLRIAAANLFSEGQRHASLQQLIADMGHDYRDPESAKQACAALMAGYFATPTAIS